jgi:hypothetical protein
MSDYELYYWSAPFAGQFVRAVRLRRGHFLFLCASVSLCENPFLKGPAGSVHS